MGGGILCLGSSPGSASWAGKWCFIGFVRMRMANIAGDIMGLSHKKEKKGR